jgi:hypothetical protein
VSLPASRTLATRSGSSVIGTCPQPGSGTNRAFGSCRWATRALEGAAPDRTSPIRRSPAPADEADGPGAAGGPPAAAETVPQGGVVRRAASIPQWRDPDTGYLRRQVSAPRFPAAVTEVTLPAGARVPYPAGAYAFIAQLVWVLSGFRDEQSLKDIALAEPRGIVHSSGSPQQQPARCGKLFGPDGLPRTSASAGGVRRGRQAGVPR